MKYDHLGNRGRGPGPGFGRGRGRGRFGRGWAAPSTSAEDRGTIRAWFGGRLPDDWYTAAPEVTVDDEEILVVGTLPDLALDGQTSDEDRRTAELARIGRFREDTRERRMQIAEEAQAAFGRVVSWGAAVGSTTATFTTAAVPVMTRLRMSERQVLDTLIDAGVARSRSEALAWCVRLVGRNEGAWIADLRRAFEQVEEVRSQGPRSGAPGAGDDDGDEEGGAGDG